MITYMSCKRLEGLKKSYRVNTPHPSRILYARKTFGAVLSAPPAVYGIASSSS